MPDRQKKFWDMKMATDGSNLADIYIYGDIEKYQIIEEDVTATTFKDELEALGEVNNINLYINSPGGNVFEGVTIYNMLQRHQAKINVHVDALAASIASVIAMAGDTIFMPNNSMMMIHNPWRLAIGNAADLRKAADDLDRIGNSVKQSYLDKTGDKLTEEKLQEMLDAETWLSADEAYEFGLCDVVEEANQMAASISDDLIQKYKNVPEKLQKQGNSPVSGEEMAERERIANEAKANSAYIDNILGGM